MQLPREKCTECGMIAHIPLLMRLARSQAISLLALFVLKEMSKEAREEFMRTLRDQIARAQGRARFMALRELEERRLVNEQLSEQLGEIEKVISVVLRGDIEDGLAMSGLEELVHMAVKLGLREGEPPAGSLL